MKIPYLISNRVIIICLCLIGSGFLPVSELHGQRTYKPHSVLASGNWFKLSIRSSGVYKIDLPFLSSLGINTSSLQSNSIRLFGNGGGMLSEINSTTRIDDLQENAIRINDGNDGVLNGQDYILFYGQGPDIWLKDSLNKRFLHQKNLYSDKTFYFLSIGGTGLRIPDAPNNLVPAQQINSFDERLYHELDTVNFLGSGKEWYGEEFANAPGKTLTRRFDIQINSIIGGQPLIVVSDLISRSVGSPSRYDITVNNQPLPPVVIPAVTSGTYDLFARPGQGIGTTSSTQSNISINYSYTPGSFNAQGWLNWFQVFCRRSLSIDGNNQLLFRDWNSVNNTNGEFVIANSTQGIQVWEITNPLSPVRMSGTLSGNQYSFVNNCSRLREYIAFQPGISPLPTAEGSVQNQDLHNTQPADNIIISHPSFLSQAQRLASFHLQRNGIRSVIVSTTQVFNEFSSGIPDPTALRDFVKMYYDKYGATVDTPRYLLLFGDASFDPKNRIVNNTNLVPAYQSTNSLDPLSTYTSDDFFGFLNDNEDINSGVITNLLDIGIGRIPAENENEAKNFVDKVFAYFDNQSLGPWRNNLTFIADDEDFNLHLQDAEVLSATGASTDSLNNIQKIYMDAYLQESGPGGSRYPKVNEAINNKIYNGTLIWNYSGHGGPSRLAEEVVLDQDIVNSWNNPNRLPLFITATCDFAPFDNPTINSIGEDILLRPRTGGIAMMTTTRVVFAFSNRIMNNNYLQVAMQRDANGKHKSLGDAVREAKNITYQTSADITNNRKFALLGDPAMTIGFPQLNIRTTSINGVAAGVGVDTLKATDVVTIEGEVTDNSGNILNDFNGTVYPVVFDKIETINTIGNDPTSIPVGFQSQTNALFKGKASVTAGKFSFSFKMPRDINYMFGNGRLSLYADDRVRDASGSFTGFHVGGAGNNFNNDTEGPGINIFLNDEHFVNGGLTNENPVLILKLTDSSGINTAGTGVGHDLVATLDNDNRQFFVLNDYYESDLDSYQSGTVKFQLPGLTPGNHSIRIKAWDVLNNSSERVLEFTVASNESLVLSHVLNYPNPFTTSTRFWFEHNRPGQDLRVNIQIFTLSGRLIKQFNKTIISTGNRSSDIEWDGRDEYGDKLGRGVYLYRLMVTDPLNQKAEKLEKLVIF